MRGLTCKLAAILLALGASSGLQACASTASTTLIRGVVWQPDNATLRPEGVWDELGAHELLIQWTLIDGHQLLPGSDDSSEHAINPRTISRAPWARSVIVGLAGAREESEARRTLEELATKSRAQAEHPASWHVSGWYFPVELDPTWADVALLRRALDALPRPLWISIYDSANLGPRALIEQVKRAVPADVGLLFQDGVGVYARTPPVARGYLDALTTAFGATRVRVIAEAFRTTPDGFRPATAGELALQVRAYAGFPIYLFDGPHYVGPELVHELAQMIKTETLATSRSPLPRGK